MSDLSDDTVMALIRAGLLAPVEITYVGDDLPQPEHEWIVDEPPTG